MFTKDMRKLKLRKKVNVILSGKTFRFEKDL